MVLPLHHDQPGRKGLPKQPLPGGLGLALARGRVHEFCGISRACLAALVLAEAQGAVIWISPGWVAERVYPPGLSRMADPGRIIFARARRPEDLLWAMEEALRSGAAPMVLCDLPAPPALTPIRRLHLACEAGAEAARHRGRLAPLGLILTPGEGGSQGVESRWQFSAAPSDSTLLENRSAWTLRRLRARMEPPAEWRLVSDAEGRIRGEVLRENGGEVRAADAGPNQG